MTAHEALKTYFGYDNFRPLQEEIIQSVINGRDTLALMPTGGGKSLCFQVPTMAMGGLCLVITPLIALMKDQVENLRRRDIRAAAIYTGMSYEQQKTALDNCQWGPYHFLYVSPERLESEEFRERLARLPICLIAVDEAHCISQWGYDFRPSYLKIAEIRDLIKAYPRPLPKGKGEDNCTNKSFPLGVKGVSPIECPERTFIEQTNLGEASLIAIGEIGLDYHWDTTFKEQQHEALREQMRWAEQYHLPVMIHSRDATEDTLKILREFPSVKGVMHCFSGSHEVAKQVVDMGYYLGIGGVLTFKNCKLAENLVGIPLERLVLETDAPYMAPVPHRGKRNESRWMRYVAEKLAEVYKCSSERVNEVTTANAKALFVINL